MMRTGATGARLESVLATFELVLSWRADVKRRSQDARAVQQKDFADHFFLPCCLSSFHSLGQRQS